MNTLMSWDRLISDRRLGLEEFHDERVHTRSDFQRDYDRLIFSSPFRRLQNKTQVFPLPGSVFVHNRLTHSLEVSSVGRSLGHEIALGLRQRHGDMEGTFDNIRDIVSAACLCHDLGNPPFGHSGEKTISTFFSEGPGQEFRGQLSERQWNDLIHFEGNANSFRLLTHQFVGRRRGGMAMTYSTLASVVKYPYTSMHAGKKENSDSSRARMKFSAVLPAPWASPKRRREDSCAILWCTWWKRPTTYATRSWTLRTRTS